MKLRYFLLLLMVGLLIGCKQESKLTKKPESVVILKSASENPKKFPNTASTATATIQSESEDFPEPTYYDGTAGKDILLTGRVLFKTGKPLPDTNIEILSDPSDPRTLSPFPYASVRSNAKGYYKIGLAKDRIYRLLANSKDATSPMISFDPKEAYSDSKNASFDFRYSLNIPVFSRQVITGVATNENGTSIPNARVWITQDEDTESFDSISTLTNTQGIFQFNYLQNKHTTICVFADGYSPTIINNISESTNAPVQVSMTPGGGAIRGNVTLKNGTPITSGTIVQLVPVSTSQTGIPLEIFMNAFQSSTDELGNYKFSGLPLTNYTVGLAQENNTYSSLPMACTKPQRILAKEGEEITHDFQVYTGHTVEGVVFDKESSAPISGIKVTTDPFVIDSITDNNGYYKLNNITENTSIHIDTEKFLSLTPISQPPLPSCDQTVLIHNIPVAEPVYISGTVTNSNDFPIAEATLTAHILGFGDKKSQSDSRGNFKFAVPPLEKVIITAKATGYAISSTPEIDPGIKDLQNISITLRTGFTLTGQIIDNNKNPVKNAKFHFRNRYPKVEAIPESGFFKISNLTSNMSITIKSKDYMSQELDFFQTAPQDNETTEINIVMQPAVTISGVVKTKNGDIQNFETSNYITATSRGYNPKFSSINAGRFSVSDLHPNTTYSLTIPDNSITTPVVAISGSKDVVILFEGHKKSPPELTTKTVIINVIDAKTRHPVSDAQVKLNNIPIPADPIEKGVYKKPNTLFSKSLFIVVSAKNYFPIKKEIGPFDLNEDINTTIELPVGGSLSGQLVESITGKPMPDVLIRSNDGHDKNVQEYTTSDSNGEFTLYQLNAGEIKISIKPDKPFVEFVQNYTIPNDDTIDIGVVRLYKGGTIDGKVLSTANQPRQGIRVNLSGTTENYNIKKSMLTGDYGEFKFTDLPPQNYKVKLDTKLYTQNVELQHDEIKTVIITESGNIFNGIIDSKSQFPYYVISATGDVNNRTYHTETSDFQFKISDMEPGVYNFKIQRTDGRITVNEKITIPNKHDSSHTFKIPSGSISGLVTDAAGNPIANVYISAKMNTEGANQSVYSGSPNAYSNNAGKFLLESLPAGSYDINASSDSGKASRNGVNIGDSDTNLKLTLSTDSGNF